MSVFVAPVLTHY